MEEHEIPIDIYTHDLLGMERSSWHQAEQPKVEFSEHTPLSSKQKYITILLCVGFLYFVGIGVWKVQQQALLRVQPFTPYQVHLPDGLSHPESILTITDLIFQSWVYQEVDQAPQLSLYYFPCVGYSTPPPAFSQISKQQEEIAQRINAKKRSHAQSPNWQPFLGRPMLTFTNFMLVNCYFPPLNKKTIEIPPSIYSFPLQRFEGGTTKILKSDSLFRLDL